MTVRIVVLADTHMTRRGRSLPEGVTRALATADHIIHLGDFTDASVISTLSQYAPLHAVHGNNDDPDVKVLFPAQQRLEIESVSLTLLHGHLGGRTARAAAAAITGSDIVLFGHSHIPYQRQTGSVLLFNPGSPTDRRQAPYRSFGMLEIDDAAVRAEIIPLP